MKNDVRILITAPGFARDDSEPIDMMRARGWTLDFNETGSMLERAELMRRIAEADGILLGTEKVDREVLDAARRLKVISRYGVGLDNVDVACAREKGIQVLNAAGANATAVADMAVTMMLMLSRGSLKLDAQVREGDWTEPVGVEPEGKLLGIVGLGNIGAQVAKRAKGFGMRVIAYDSFRNEKLAAEAGVAYVDTLDELLARADYVTLHVPHTAQTHHMIGRAQLDAMKPGAILINTARGGIIDEAALAEALQSGRLGGAGLDVFEEEPLPLDSPLLKCPRTVFSPHTAADTHESARKVSLATVQNMIKVLQ